MVRVVITKDRNPNKDNNVVSKPTPRTMNPASLLFCKNSKPAPITIRITPNTNIASINSIKVIVSSPYSRI